MLGQQQRHQAGGCGHQADAGRQREHAGGFQAAFEQGQALIALASAHHAQQDLVEAHQRNQRQVHQFAGEVDPGDGAFAEQRRHQAFDQRQPLAGTIAEQQRPDALAELAQRRERQLPVPRPPALTPDRRQQCQWHQQAAGQARQREGVRLRRGARQGEVCHRRQVEQQRTQARQHKSLTGLQRNTEQRMQHQPRHAPGHNLQVAGGKRRCAGRQPRPQ